MFYRQINDDTYLQYLEDHHAQEIKEMIDKNRNHLSQWIERFNSISSEQEIKNLIHFCSGSFKENKSLFPGIWYKNTFVGVAGLHVIDWKNKKACIAVWLAENVQGKGLARLGFTEMINYAFHELGLNRLEAYVAVENTKPANVVLGLNFKQEGVLRKSEILHGKPTDFYVFGLLREEWK